MSPAGKDKARTAKHPALSRRRRRVNLNQRRL